jgi:DNA-binding MarR family transcriptional regulator
MAGNRVLNNDEMATWRALFEVSTLVLDQLDRRLGDESELSLGEYEVLSVLADGPKEGIRMTALAQQVLVSKTRLTYTIDRLEREGMVRRTPCPTDRRGTLAVISAQGRRAVTKATPGHLAAVRELVFDNLSGAQQTQLHRALKAIRAEL